MIGVAVLSFQRRKQLERCLTSLQRYRDRLYLLVTDNASPMDQRIWLQQLAIDGVVDRVVQNDTNVGWARAKNQGLRELLGYEYILLLEGDVEVEGNWPEACIALCQSGIKAIMGRVRLPHKDGALLARRTAVLDGVGKVPLALCPDFLMKFAFLDRAAVLAVGGIDKTFDGPWGAYADIDYGVRLMKAGFTQGPFAVALEPPLLKIREGEDKAYEKEFDSIKQLAIEKNKDLYLRRRRAIFAGTHGVYSPLEY
jgi:GT2 family glycosyltransferase